MELFLRQLHAREYTHDCKNRHVCMEMHEWMYTYAQDISRFYGAHHPLWYLYEGRPPSTVLAHSVCISSRRQTQASNIRLASRLTHTHTHTHTHAPSLPLAGVPVVVASWLPWLAMAAFKPDENTRGVAKHMLWSAAFAVTMLRRVCKCDVRGHG